jgi:branched-subunit amino acid ABC-type transport system permease component
VIYRHVGPRRDHVELGADEQRALVELERALSSSGGARRGLARSRRLAPWLLPIGAVLMVVAIPVSVPLAFVCSLLMTVGLAAALDRTGRGARLRRARRRSPDQ